MAGKWIEFMPKTQIFGSFKQSTGQALELGKIQASMIRVKADFDTSQSPGSDALVVTVEEANANEDSAYTPSDTKSLSLDTNSGYTVVNTRVLAVAARFIRLDLSTTLAAGAGAGWMNVQVELLIE